MVELAFTATEVEVLATDTVLQFAKVMALPPAVAVGMGTPRSKTSPALEQFEEFEPQTKLPVLLQLTILVPVNVVTARRGDIST